MNDVWAVGGDSASPAILHWDGTTWSRATTATNQWLEAVWGSAANDVWVLGLNDVALHWDGISWTQVQGAAGVNAVWGSGSNDVWGVGDYGRIAHWDGTSWTVVPSNTGYDLRAVWGSGPNDVYAATTNNIMHWDGSAWGLAADRGGLSGQRGGLGHGPERRLGRRGDGR